MGNWHASKMGEGQSAQVATMMPDRGAFPLYLFVASFPEPVCLTKAERRRSLSVGIDRGSVRVWFDSGKYSSLEGRRPDIS